MPQPQVDNPRGAFGYTTQYAGTATAPYHQPEVRVFRNVSPSPILYGQLVTLYVNSSAPYGSSAGGTSGVSGTTADDCIYATTIASQRGVIGIALTGASSYSTNASSNLSPAFNAAASQYCQVVVGGPFYGALVTSVAHAPGDYLVNTASTVSQNIQSPQGGIGGAATTLTVPVTTAQMALRTGTVVGIFITTGTTVGSTLFASSKSVRANVWVQPSMIANISGTT